MTARTWTLRGSGASTQTVNGRFLSRPEVGTVTAGRPASSTRTVATVWGPAPYNTPALCGTHNTVADKSPGTSPRLLPIPLNLGKWTSTQKPSCGNRGSPLTLQAL